MSAISEPDAPLPLHPLLAVGVLHGDVAIPEREDVAAGDLHPGPVSPGPGERPLREAAISHEEVAGASPLGVRKRLENLGEGLADLARTLVAPPADLGPGARLEDAIRGHGRHDRPHVLTI